MRSIAAAGQAHACAVIAGILSCWGSNARGELGLGDTEPRLTPAHVTAAGEWIAVTAGEESTCGIASCGTVYCWGSNDHGQLGLGDFALRMSPSVVALPRPARRIDSAFHTCAILDDGVPRCWGYNFEGSLGLGDPADSPDVPTPAVPAGDPEVTAIATGDGHTIVAGARVLGTGRNTSYQLGIGTLDPGQLRVFTPIDEGVWIDVAAGQDGSCAIRAEHSLWCWGVNAHGEVGTGDLMPRTTPTLIGAPQTWTGVAMDAFHTCAVTTTNDLYCWGRNIEGQLGTGDDVDHLTPTQTGGGFQWRAVAVGRFFSCGLQIDDSVWCTGDNSFAQLGTGDLARRLSWTRLVMPE